MRTAAFILQIICLILVTLGIAIELEYDASLGFLLITVGSILFAISTKIKKNELQSEIKKLKQSKEVKNENKNRLVSKMDVP